MSMWCAMRVMAGVRQTFAATFGLAMLLFAACGGDGDEPSVPGPDKGTAGDGHSSGSSDEPLADGGPSGADSGANGSNAGGGGQTAQHELFTDSSVPDCLVPGAPWKLEGSIDSQSIMLGSDIYSSDLLVGELHVVGYAPGAADGGASDSHHPLILTWDGGVTKGEVKPLTGKRFLLPGDPKQPAGYCITAGEIGPSMYSPGALFKFRIRSVRRYEMGACTGPEQPATLSGCLFRVGDSMP